MTSFRLNNKTAIVTGAGQGLGRAMALALSQAGADVAILDIDLGSAEAVAGEIRALGQKAIPVKVDVRDGVQVRQALSDVVDELNGVHILVNNAGITSNAPFEELPEEDWDRVLQINLTGLFNLSKWVSQHMISQQVGGSIINISSISGLVGNRGGNNSHYCATKGGVIALTRSLAVEWAPHRIRVNSIAPGYFETAMTDRLRERDPNFYDELVNRVPLKRFGRSEDLSGAVIYLASDASTYISGHVLVVDGAYTAW